VDVGPKACNAAPRDGNWRTEKTDVDLIVAVTRHLLEAAAAHPAVRSA
jgi:hypothetical protein